MQLQRRTPPAASHAGAAVTAHRPRTPASLRPRDTRGARGSDATSSRAAPGTQRCARLGRTSICGKVRTARKGLLESHWIRHPSYQEPLTSHQRPAVEPQGAAHHRLGVSGLFGFGGSCGRSRTPQRAPRPTQTGSSPASQAMKFGRQRLSEADRSTGISASRALDAVSSAVNRICRARQGGRSACMTGHQLDLVQPSTT